MKTIFEEKQQFRQWWMWLILLVLLVFPFIEIIKPFLVNDTENIAKVNPTMIAIILVPILLIVALFIVLKLTTKITSEGIEMQYFPFTKKKVSWQEIESTEILDYGFVGGWGIRFGSKYGTIYNVKGSKGLHIKLKNGKQFLIGSQKNDELEKALKEIKN